MTLERPIPELVTSRLDEGYDAAKIAGWLKGKACKRTVCAWVKRIYDSGIEARTSPGRPRYARKK